MAKKVTIHRDHWHGEKKRYDRVFTEIEYPDWGKLHWDANQRTLRILSPEGEPLTAFSGVVQYITPGITISKPTSYDDEAEQQ